MTDNDNRAGRAQSAHRIQVSTPAVTIEVAGSEEFVTNHFAELEEQYLAESDPRSEISANATESGWEKSEKPPTLSEINREIELPYKRDAALLTGWYLEHVDGTGEFSRTDIEEKANNVKLELGQNVARDIGALVERGLLRHEGEREGSKMYLTTRTGEKRVLDDLGVKKLQESNTASDT